MENNKANEPPVKPDKEKKVSAPADIKGKSKNEKQEYKVIEIKRYKLAELADIYQVNRKTFRGWLNKFKGELGEREGYYYSIPQVKLIFQKLELPSYVKLYLDEPN